MKPGFRVTDSGPQTASLNMATDEAILVGFINGVSPPTLRFYSFSPSAITIGRFQKPSDQLLSEAVNYGLSVVRRPTGGRAVVHNGDLTYSVVAGTDDSLFGGSTIETYRKISERLVHAFKDLGADVSAESNPGGKYEKSASCFDSTVTHELRSGREKIAGGAQVRQSGAFLQQGSIVLVEPEYDFERLFGRGSKTPAGLSSLLVKRVSYEEVRMAIQNSFGCAMRADTLNEFELARREELLLKYESSRWNDFGKSASSQRGYESFSDQIRC